MILDHVDGLEINSDDLDRNSNELGSLNYLSAGLHYLVID